jgi:hypothetical protein
MKDKIKIIEPFLTRSMISNPDQNRDTLPPTEPEDRDWEWDWSNVHKDGYVRRVPKIDQTSG